MEDNVKDEKKSFLYKYKVDILFVITIALVAFILSNNYSFLFVQGDSMYPTYSHKDILILDKEKDITNGDIVVFNSPETWSKDSKKFIKRIVASEGDMLKISNDELIVNGEVVAKTAEKKCGLKENVEFNIDKNKFFVLGDNYSSSNDSLTQFCNKSENFLVDKEQLILNGKELTVIGGF